MPFTQSLLVALFCITVVFGVLALIFVCIRVFSMVLGNTGKKNKQDKTTEATPQAAPKAAAPAPTPVAPVGTTTSGGADFLVLENVDEPTAAMIMAMVSDHSGIPLTELRFESIKLIG